MQVISEFNIGHKKNSIHYPVKQFLVQFWRQQEKKTHRQIDWLIDWLLLQFTTARLITNYDGVLLQFTIAWLLQFWTTAITIYDRWLHFTTLLQFTIEQLLHGTIRNDDLRATQRCNIGTMLCPLETVSQQCCYAVLH